MLEYIVKSSHHHSKRKKKKKMKYLCPDDYWITIFENSLKFLKSFAIPSTEKEQWDFRMAINVLNLNSPEFDRNFMEFSRQGKIRMKKFEYLSRCENLLVRFSLAGMAPKIFSTPVTYGERFRAIFYDDCTDLKRRLDLRLTAKFRTNLHSGLRKLQPHEYEFVLRTKNMNIHEIFDLLERYCDKEIPLLSVFVAQLIADRCTSVEHLKKLNSLIRRKVYHRVPIFHVIKYKCSHLRIRQQTFNHPDF